MVWSLLITAGGGLHDGGIRLCNKGENQQRRRLQTGVCTGSGRVQVGYRFGTASGLTEEDCNKYRTNTEQMPPGYAIITEPVPSLLRFCTLFVCQ